MKIKILHIAKTVGGVGVFTSLNTKYINNNIFESILIHNYNDDNIEHFDSSGKKIDTFNVAFEREINPIKDIKNLLKIYSLTKKIKPHIIHCHSAKAGVYGRIIGNLLKIPTLYTPHAYSFLSSRNKLKNKVFKIIENYFGNLKYSFIIACSDSEKEQALNINIKADKIRVWNNSIPNIVFNHEKNTDNILVIARTTFQKNLEMLIDVAELLEKKHFKKNPPRRHFFCKMAAIYRKYSTPYC